MAPHRSILAALLGSALIPQVVQAAFSPETGSYVFQYYSAKNYGASPQNWAIAEDRRGIVYFANTAGLLEFDGVAWRVIHLPGVQIVRSVAVDRNGTVYVGGVGDFGFLKPDTSGTLQFTSLRDKIPEKDRQFADVWRVLPSPQGVYFSSSSRLFRLNRDGAMKIWRPEKRFARAFSVLNTLYVQTAGKGLMRMGANDELSLAPGGERFISDVVHAAVPAGEGAIIATAARLYRLTLTGVEPMATAADRYFTDKVIYSMQTLRDGEIAIGTRSGGLVLLNSAGALDRILSKSSGLADEWVSAIHEDRQGGVWLAENNGIARFNPGLSRFDKTSGLEGDVQCMSRYNGAMYAGTTGGLFRMEAATGEAPRFEHVAGIKYTVWALVPYGNDLLAASDEGVFLVSGKRAEKIFESSKTIWDVTPSRLDPATIFAVGRAGAFALRKAAGKWEKISELVMPGQEFRSVIEDNDGRVWATTNGNVWRIDFRVQPASSEKFGVSQGVPPGWVNVRRFEGSVVFATSKGLKTFSGKSFAPDTNLDPRFFDGSRDVFNIFADREGNVWVTGEGYHGVLVRAAGGYRWEPAPLLHSGIEEIYWMSLDDDGTAWAVGADFVLHRWERALAGNPDQGFEALTRRVQVSGSGKVLYGGAGTRDSIHLPWRENAVRFEFAAPFFEEPSAVEYQVRLEGIDRAWSAWTHEAQKDYTNLSEGGYRFHVRARSPHGPVSENAALSFAVLPPWYRTWWAYMLYAFCGAFAVWGVVRLRTGQLEAEKRQLENIVEERTVEIREQRDEIQRQERKGHSLLLNILPAAVADELKATGSVKPVGFDDVTVCFTDFVGFTLSSERMPPANLVDALNEYFTAFDEIVARYGLEKLKTIGDSYMFVSGLPSPCRSHAVDAVLAALEMAQVVQNLAARSGGTGWNIRIGLHSGPVVAGVVGIRKFAFDIWGNTVNFAARMESSGVPGWVNLSERTCRLTHGLIDCESRGHVRIKEGRELPMFRAVRPVDDFSFRYREEFGEEPRYRLNLKSSATVVTASTG